jgi:hypothetical protein
MSSQNVPVLKRTINLLCERLEGDVAMIGSLLGHKISSSNLSLSASIVTRLIDCGMACDIPHHAFVAHSQHNLCLSRSRAQIRCITV